MKLDIWLMAQIINGLAFISMIAIFVCLVRDASARESVPDQSSRPGMSRKMKIVLSSAFSFFLIFILIGTYLRRYLIAG